MNEKTSDVKSYIDYLIKWLRELSIKTKTNGFVVGVSGGVDSALVATLVKKANDNSLGVWIDIDSSEDAKKNAMRVINDLNLKYQEINLSEINQSLSETILLNSNAKNINQELTRLAIGNTKSRLRMVTLYQIANWKNFLVVGTSNKDEIYVGYYTKFGDGSADIYPIASLSKEEVYLLARELKINEEILNATPSGDLWENQSDEEELGVTYQEISAHREGKCLDLEKKKIIERYHLNSAHKRNPMIKPANWE